MALALTSEFLPANPITSRRITARPARPSPSPAVVFAQLNPPPFPSFRLGKREEKASEADSGKPAGNGGFFDFGRVADVNSLVPVVAQSSPFALRRKDPRTVFVAGATGQAGVRIAQSLLRQGFTVRAGVPELAAAQELARLAAQYKVISVQEAKKLNAVQSGFLDQESIAKAIGNAGKVVVTVGSAENGPSSPVSIADAIKVVVAASLAGVSHLAVVYDPSADSPVSTYNVLDGLTTFFSNIFSKTQPLTLSDLLQKIVETDVRYTLLKASLADDSSSDYSANLVVAAEGASGSEYKVSKSQIATLVAGVFSDTSVAENKVVQVSTSPTSSKPISELLGAIPEDDRRKTYAQALAKAKEEEEAIKASERAREASEASKRKLEEEVKKLSKQEAKKEVKADVSEASVESFLNRAKDLSGGFSWDKLSSQFTRTVSQKIDELPKRKIEVPKTQIATLSGEAKARRLPTKKAIVKQPPPRPAPAFRAQRPKQEAAKSGEVRKVLGGLFKQETIYVDDD